MLKLNCNTDPRGRGIKRKKKNEKGQLEEVLPRSMSGLVIAVIAENVFQSSRVAYSET